VIAKHRDFYGRDIVSSYIKGENVMIRYKELEKEGSFQIR
jgi:hypothetical protein